jgi:hypothetical protein
MDHRTRNALKTNDFVAGQRSIPRSIRARARWAVRAVRVSTPLARLNSVGAIQLRWWWGPGRKLLKTNDFNSKFFNDLPPGRGPKQNLPRALKPGSAPRDHCNTATASGRANGFSDFSDRPGGGRDSSTPFGGTSPKVLVLPPKGTSTPVLRPLEPSY